MKRPHHRWWIGLLLIGLIVGGSHVVPSCTAGDLEQLDTSVKLIPGNAAFFSSMLRNREVIERIGKSNAWAKLMNLPLAQLGLKEYRLYAGDPESELGKALAVMENPEVQKWLALAADMGSNDIFVYGRESVGTFYGFMQNFYNGMNYKMLMLQVSNPFEARKRQAQVAVSALVENLDALVVPEMVIGFKLKNAEAGQEAMVKLEMMFNMALQAAPPLQGRFKKETVGKDKFLVLRLDGEMLPWPLIEMQLAQPEEEGVSRADIEKLEEHVKAMKLVIALGLRGDYLLASVGSSLKCLEDLGAEQGKRLIDRPEMKPLGQFTDQKLLGITYISKPLNEKLNNYEQQFNNLLALAKEALPMAKLKPEQNERILSDAKTLVEDVKGWIPKAGAVSAVSLMNDRGVETYQYAWGDQYRTADAKPLSLLGHVGGDPILGVVGREKQSLEQYETLVKWMKKGWGYFQEIGLASLNAEERETVEKFAAEVIPLLARLDRANRELLFPALQDGQAGLVVDAKFKSKRLHEELPEMEQPMPWPEIAMVWSVSDAEKLKEGVKEYYDVLNDVLDVIRKHEPGSIPEEFRLPQPKIAKKGGATLYAFPLPKAWGLDKHLAPNAGLTKETAAVSLTPGTTRRLLKAAPLTVGGVLSDPEKPRTAAAWLNWAALVEAGRPWIDYALSEAELPQIKDMDANAIAEQVHAVLDVLKVFQSLTMETYPEEGCMVTHSLMEIKDLPAEETTKAESEK
jgi:hypothetical protein